MAVFTMTRRRSVGWGLAGLTLVVVALIAWPARSQTQDLDVLKVIPENYKLLLDNPFVG